MQYEAGLFQYVWINCNHLKEMVGELLSDELIPPRQLLVAQTQENSEHMFNFKLNQCFKQTLIYNYWRQALHYTQLHKYSMLDRRNRGGG